MTLFLLRVIIQFSISNKLKFNLFSIGTILFSCLTSFLFTLLLFKKLLYYLVFYFIFSISLYYILSLSKNENETISRRLYLSLLFGSFWAQSISFAMFYVLNLKELKDDI